MWFFSAPLVCDLLVCALLACVPLLGNAMSRRRKGNSTALSFIECLSFQVNQDFLSHVNGTIVNPFHLSRLNCFLRAPIVLICNFFVSCANSLTASTKPGLFCGLQLKDSQLSKTRTVAASAKSAFDATKDSRNNHWTFHRRARAVKIIRLLLSAECASIKMTGCSARDLLNAGAALFRVAGFFWSRS